MIEEVKDIIISPRFAPLFQENGITTRYVLVTGGRGSSKSFTISVWLHDRTYEKGHKILFTRHTMDSAEDSVIPEFKEKIDMLRTDADFTIRRTQISNKVSKSIILFRGIKTSSGNQTAKLKSITGITIFVVDEGEEMSEKDFDIIDKGIRSKNARNIVVIVMNPADTGHWVYKRFIADHHEFEMHDDYPVPISKARNVTHIHTTYLDNLANLDEEYLQSVIYDLKEADPDQYAAKIIGTWADIKTGLEAYSKYSFGTHVRILPFNRKLAVNASFDQNVVPYAYTSLWQIIYSDDGKLTLHCYDEIVARPPKHHTGETCNEIKRRHNRMIGFNYFGDSSGNKRNDITAATTSYKIVAGKMEKYINHLSNQTWRQNPNVKKRLEFINLIFAGYFKDIEIVISPKCVTMQQDLAKVKIDLNGSKLKEMDTVDGVRFQKVGHATDTLDYFVIKVLEKRWLKFLKSKKRGVRIYN